MSRDLKSFGLRETQSRRPVIHALEKLKKPASPQEIHARILASESAINSVTVYRVLSVFETAGIVHRHPCDGRFTICSLPDEPGHHGFLHCSDCGKIEEFHDHRLCALEDSIARRAQFSPHGHVSEILGTCARCSS